MSDEDQKPELTLEIAFNNLVGVAREMKLNHNEHTLLERSVQKVLEGLNELAASKDPLPPEEDPPKADEIVENPPKADEVV